MAGAAGGQSSGSDSKGKKQGQILETFRLWDLWEMGPQQQRTG